MRLQRLRIDQLRQFREPLEITEFSSGINLFTGPNESGKTTLVRAIRAAFFERHRSSSIDDLQPWGDTSAAPQIELDFEHQGQLWRLSKRFLQRKRCDLSIDAQQLSGEDAEDMLASMLGFQFPGRGASKAEHWGVPGLLWIEQGTGHELKLAVANAGEHLKIALGASLGSVTSTGGDDVISAVSAMRADLLTKTGKATGEYSEIRQKLAEAQSALQALDERIIAYRSQVDRLGELTRQQEQDDADRPWERLREQQRIAQEQYAEVDQLNQQQAASNAALQECQASIELVASHMAGLQSQRTELASRMATRDHARSELSRLQDQWAGLQTSLAQANTAYAAARDNERRARTQASRAAITREQEQLTRQLDDLNRKLEIARSLHNDLQAQQHQLGANTIDLKALERLKELSRQGDELAIRQQSMATRLHVALEPGQEIELDGQPLQGSSERLLLREAELVIAGVGRMRISPGGEDLGDLVRKIDRNQDGCSALLKQLQVESLEQAQQRAERQRLLQADIASGQKLLASHAPDGIDALALEGQRLQQRHAFLQAELGKVPASDDEQPLCPSETQRQLEHAIAQLKLAETACNQHQQHIARAEQSLDAATEEYRKLKATLDGPEQEQREQESARRLLELRAREAALKAEVVQRAARIAQARPEILAQDIKRYGDSAAQTLAAYDRRKLELMQLQAQLYSLDADGLEERREKLASQLQEYVRRRDQLQRRAEALDLLVDMLATKRQALTRRLQAPLQKHLNHYLGLLFPQASLEVDEHLVPGQLLRHGPRGAEAGDFDALSFGAREQMGLISRLAYADLLKESGKPTLIILDDALVHSDQQRLAQMKRILFDASQRHQVLLFSCHPDNWRDLGVVARDIQSLKGNSGRV